MSRIQPAKITLRRANLTSPPISRPNIVSTPNEQQNSNITVQDRMTIGIIEKAEQAQANNLSNIDNVSDKYYLIPVNEHDKPEHQRTNVMRYFVISPGCTHATHNYSSSSPKELEHQSVKYIPEEKYGVDFPIVPQSRLVYCLKCLPKDHDILKKSVGRGSLNFYIKEGTRHTSKHAIIPKYVNQQIPIQTCGDNVWVNLLHNSIDLDDIQGIKDLIIYESRRKNFINVFSLPPPFADLTEQFLDFGTVTFLATSSAGYDTDLFTISDNNQMPDEDGIVFDQEYDDDIIQVLPTTNPFNKKQKEEKEVITQNKIVSDISPLTPMPAPKPARPSKSPSAAIPTPVSDPQKIDDVDAVKCTFPDCLILNMTQPSEFESNKLFFKTYFDIDVQLATYNYCDLSVNVVGILTDTKKNEVISKLENDGYCVGDIKDVTICINQEILFRWSFVIYKIIDKNSSWNSSYDEIMSENVKQSSNKEVHTAVCILEMLYFKNKSSNDPSPIIYNFADKDLCRGMDERDLLFLFNYGFSYEWVFVDERGANSSRLMIELLNYLKYNSRIPLNNCIFTYDSITIMT